MKPSMTQLLNSKHISYANTLQADEQPDYCHKHAQALIPDATITQVKNGLYAVTSGVDGKTVLVNGARLTKKNRPAIAARLQPFGAGLCVDCQHPHPLSALHSIEELDELEEGVA